MGSITRSFVFKLRHYFNLSPDFRQEITKILVTFNTILFASFSICLFIIVDSFLLNTYIVIIDLIGLLGFISALLAIRKGKFNLGRIIPHIVASFCIINNASGEGRIAGNQFLWFPLFCSVFIIYERKEWKMILLSFFISGTSLLFMEITDYNFGGNKNLDPSILKLNAIISFGISLSMLIFFIYHLVDAHLLVERKLKKVNNSLNQSNKNLKKSNSELDSFVYKASHDLRAPLASILGLIDLTKKENDLEKIRLYLSLKEVSVKKLDSLILDILDLSKNARLEISREKIDFKKMVEESFSSFTFLEYYDNIQKNIVIDQHADFYSDDRRIQIILNNLISNSIRYIDISKEIPKVDVSIDINKERAVLIVADNGQGIQTEHLTKVYKMFFRGNEKKTGSGLGLYIVKETIDKLKGKIEVKSEYGQWTVFMLVLPNMQPNSQQSKQ